MKIIHAKIVFKKVMNRLVNRTVKTVLTLWFRHYKMQ